MTAMKVYDPDQYRCTFNGFSFSKGAGASGYADGIFVSVEQMEPSFLTKVGTDGTVSRSKTNARLVKLLVRLMNTESESNGFLSTMLALDESNPNGAGVGAFSLEDLQGTTRFFASKAWVSGPPKQALDREANEREWEIHGVRDILIVGGN